MVQVQHGNSVAGFAPAHDEVLLVNTFHFVSVGSISVVTLPIEKVTMGSSRIRTMYGVLHACNNTKSQHYKAPQVHNSRCIE